MSENKFTHSTWHVVKYDGTDFTAIADESGNEILGTSEWLRCERSDLDIIAAAPELLEALLAALEWIDSVPENTVLPTMPGFDRDWVDEVISKAKGEL